MRISNNALRFLLAQYRSIFKQAYIKGLATAVLLTAGLAVGQAQAVNLTHNNLPDAGQVAYITGDSEASGSYDENGSGEFSKLDINTSGTHTLNGTIIFNSGVGGNNYILGQGTEALKLTGNGAIEVNVTSSDANAPSEQGIFIHGHGQDTTVDIKELKVTRGELDISDKNSESSEDSKGDVVVAADTITIGSASGGDTTQAFLNLLSKGDAKTATLGRADDTSGRSDSKITVYNDGLLTVATSTGSGTQILGDELNILAGGVMLTNDGNANTVASKNLTVAAESFKVISGDGTSETFTGQTGLIQGNFLIDEGASWVLDAADGATLNMTFASGANVQLGGSVSVDAGNLIVEEGAGLYATSTTDSSIKLNQDGSLAIASTDLYKFLKGQDQSGDNINYQPIQGSDGEYSLDDTPAQANQGAILLSGGGTLKFTDAEQIDLANDFSFSDSNTTKAGYISVSGGGTIIAKDILIAKKLGDANDPMYPSRLQIDVNELTLGDDQETITGQLGFSRATTHNLTVLHTADNDENAFNLHNHLSLRATSRDVTMDGDIVEVAEDGTIDGNLNIIGQANLTVEAGHYTTKDNLTVSNGKLIVSGSNSNDTVLASSLTIQGDFKLNKTGSGSNDLAQVEITGATGASATLDLSQANSITWGSGSVIISGAESGAGTLKISGSQLEQYQDTTKTQSTITLADQGILSVVGSTTSLDLNVTDFSKVSAASGAIFFSGAGTVAFDTEQTISSSGDALSIGAGTIKAPALTLENTKEGATEFVVSGGIIQVESSLSSNQSKVSFIANNQSGGILLLDRADTATGTVKVDTSFSGNNSALKVTQGNWEFSEGHDAYFSGGADFNIGTADTIASLKIDNINFTETNTEATSTIQAGSSLTANTMQAGSGATFTIAGSLTIKGLDNIDSGSQTDPAASYSDTAGINLSGATFNVSGADAKLTIGQTATNALIKLPNSSNDTLTVAEALSGSTINLTDFATLNLEFDQDVKLSTADAKALKSQLFANGDVGDGIINVGKAELSINWEQDQDLVAKWDEVKDFGAMEAVTSDDLRQALIIEISGSVAGHYGAMQVDPNETLSVDGVLGPEFPGNLYLS